jgi:hypothetical protein
MVVVFGVNGMMGLIMLMIRRGESASFFLQRLERFRNEFGMTMFFRNGQKSITCHADEYQHLLASKQILSAAADPSEIVCLKHKKKVSLLQNCIKQFMIIFM